MAVLSKKEDVAQSRDMHAITDVHTILGPESTFEGKLVFDGTVRIDGTFKGEIRTDAMLVVGQGARVEATVEVGSIVIHGEVHGDVRAKKLVEIHAPGHLRGNVETPQLLIERGVVFEGQCKMEDALQAQKDGTLTVLKPSPDGKKSPSGK